MDSLLPKTSEIYFKRDLGVEAAQLTSLLTTRRGAARLYGTEKSLIYNPTPIEFLVNSTIWSDLQGI